MNKLEIILGEEYKVKVEKLEKFNESLFRDLYIQAFKKTKEILSANATEDKSEHYNNIIAFVGERGTGKTSSMLSVSGALKDKFKMGNKYFGEFDLMLDNGNKLSSYNFHSVGVVDPSMLSHNNNILEIVIAKMFQGFKKHLDSNSYTEINEDKKRDLIKNFQEVFNNLKTTKNGKELAKEDSLDALLAISASTDFKKHIGNLVESYLEFIVGESKDKNNVLLLEIDDIDLNTKHAYDMIEQIRKYLILPNVVILMAVKIEQLSEIIEREMAEEFKIMLDKKQMNFDSIKNMAEKYLEKFIPFERRLSLPYLFDISKDCMMIIRDKNKPDDEKNDENYQSIDSELRELIYRKTDMLFLDGKYIVPSNLRGLIELVVLLTGFDNVKEEGTFNRLKERAEVIQSEGYRSFKKYFFSTWTQTNLPKKYSSILVELYNKPIESKNKYTVNKIEDLYSFISKDEKYLQRAEVKNYIELQEEYQEIVHLNNTDYNVSLGDVLFVLNKANKYKIDDDDKRFFYGIKTVYSFMLYETFAIDDKEYKFNKRNNANNKDRNYKNYKTLLGGYIYNPSIYPLMRKDSEGKYRSRRDVNISALNSLADKILSNIHKEDGGQYSKILDFAKIIGIFDDFVIRDVSFNDVQRYRQELTPIYEKRSLGSLRSLKKAQFDIFGFLFSHPSEGLYIGSIEVLEKILEKRYPYYGSGYSENIRGFLKEISEFVIPTNFSSHYIEFNKISAVEEMLLLIDLVKVYNMVDNFDDIFKPIFSMQEILQIKEELLRALRLSKNTGEVAIRTIKPEMEQLLKVKSFQNPKLPKVRDIKARVEEWIEKIEEYKDWQKIEKNGTVKYKRSKINDDLKKLVDEFFKNELSE